MSARGYFAPSPSPSLPPSLFPCDARGGLGLTRLRTILPHPSPRPDRNLVKALPWYRNARTKLADPAYRGWFLGFKPGGSLPNGSYHVPPCTASVEGAATKCSDLCEDCRRAHSLCLPMRSHNHRGSRTEWHGAASGLASHLARARSCPGAPSAPVPFPFPWWWSADHDQEQTPQNGVPPPPPPPPVDGWDLLEPGKIPQPSPDNISVWGLYQKSSDRTTDTYEDCAAAAAAAVAAGNIAARYFTWWGHVDNASSNITVWRCWMSSPAGWEMGYVPPGVAVVSGFRGVPRPQPPEAWGDGICPGDCDCGPGIPCGEYL